MFVPRLQAIHHPQHLRRIPPRTRGIGHDQPDHLLRIDDENAADRKGNALGIHIRRVLVVQHVVQVRHLPLLVADDGEGKLRAGDLVDVPDPAAVRLDRVGRQPDQLDVALRELRLQLGEGAQLRRAHGRVVFRVREEHDPRVADEFVEVDGAGGCFGLEVGRRAAEAESEGKGGAGQPWLDKRVLGSA